MYISKLKIKNFKCFDEVEINFDPNFNLIIGENNSGKSTIFDGLRLWQLAFQKFLKDRTNNQQSSFYVSQFYSFTIDDISFLRILDFKNLFKNNSKKEFEISLTISDGVSEVFLPIFFLKTTKGQVLNFQLCKLPNLRPIASQKISQLFKIPLGADFKELLLFTYINPIFLLPNKEPQYSKGYILNKLHKAKANEIIRNLLFAISPESKKMKKEEKTDKLIHIENSIKEILKIENINFSKRLEDDESFIKIFSKNEIFNTEVEINQLGSGTINVLNILAVLAYGDYEKFSLNALLLDEPDSHLHFNHQSRLYKHLETVSLDENKQIFIITHNSSLISQFENVLYINKKQKVINPISLNDYLEKHLKLMDENHYNVMKELHIAKNEREEIEKQLHEITRPTLFCEGSTDVTILKKAYYKLYVNLELFEDKLDIIGEGGASKVNNHLQYNSNSEICIIGLFDRDKEGKEHFDRLQKDGKGFNLVDSSYFHCVKSNSKTNAITIPIPESRNNSWFNENLFIEYLFSDDTLQNCGVELEQLDYMTFKIIKSKIGKDFKKDNDIEKDKIIKNIDNLSKEDFKHFIPLFEKIAEIINFTLPKVEIND